MKNLLIFILVAFSLGYTQGAPSANAYNIIQPWDLDRNFSIGLLDTLLAADSVTLLTKTALAEDCDYILRVGQTTGSGNDSVEVIIYVDGKAGLNDTAHIMRKPVDTVLTATGEEIMLPMNASMHFPKYTVKAIGGAKNGGVVILNDWSLIKRKKINR